MRKTYKSVQNPKTLFSNLHDLSHTGKSTWFFSFNDCTRGWWLKVRSWINNSDEGVVGVSQVPRPNLRCGSGERTPQELGKKLWSHITQKISMVIIKSWCLLENCTRGEATDVGVTHSSSSVAQQEAVLGHLPFATSPWQSLYYWICWFSSLVFATRSTSIFLASNFQFLVHCLRP